MLILTIFFSKKCNFWQFSSSESEKYGETFEQFLMAREKIDFFGRIFTYVQHVPDSKTHRWHIFIQLRHSLIHFFCFYSDCGWSRRYTQYINIQNTLKLGLNFHRIVVSYFMDMKMYLPLIYYLFSPHISIYFKISCALAGNLINTSIQRMVKNFWKIVSSIVLRNTVNYLILISL